MTQKKIAGGSAHKIPEDLQKAIFSNKVAFKAWEDITPIAPACRQAGATSGFVGLFLLRKMKQERAM